MLIEFEPVYRQSFREGPFDLAEASYTIRSLVVSCHVTQQHGAVASSTVSKILSRSCSLVIESYSTKHSDPDSAIFVCL